MAASGWKQLIPAANPFRKKGAFPIDAYSEFLPPPRVGWKPYGPGMSDPQLFHDDDPFGWLVDEFEESREIRPGLRNVANQVLEKLSRLIHGEHGADIPKRDLTNNPYWPPELAAAGHLSHDRCVVLIPLALSRTQDDKGRVRWTLFGCSELGPSKPFWRGFYQAPGREQPAESGIRFLQDLLRSVFGKPVAGADGLLQAGFRILPAGEAVPSFASEGVLPGWTEPFRIDDKQSLGSVKYLLTFRPFSQLPAAARKAYLAGKLQLIPSPASLIFWGTETYMRLRKELPLALQIPLLHTVTRHRAPIALRIPQGGFFHIATEGHPDPLPHAGPVRNGFRRTHRWDKVHRDQDELASLPLHEEHMWHVLFSTDPDDVRLYDKPQARNAQLWTEDGHLILDGPRAGANELKKAAHSFEGGGLFGYRFSYPAMRVGRHEVYWHRLLAAYRTPEGKVVVMPEAPTGYLTAYDADNPQPEKAIELWPRILNRPFAAAIVSLYEAHNAPEMLATARNLRKLLDAAALMGGPLPRSLARQLLSVSRETTLDGWLESLPDPELAREANARIEPESAPLPRRPGSRTPDALTYGKTARRSFEETYWKTIAELAESKFLNKNNADCVNDQSTQRNLTYLDPQLPELADYLLKYYQRKIEAAEMRGKALAGEVPFRWETSFEYAWMGGWERNEQGPAERDLLVVIPGRDRGRAVIMADHYDTAYMADRYHTPHGPGPRLAACGADDNHSATAALMLAAPIFLDLSRRGELGCDIWLVHLTGEEFPADCLGARALTQRLVEENLELVLAGGKRHDLSKVRVQGVYVSDMIAHNNDHFRNVFQISPGTGRDSLWLAYQAHLANEIWNASAEVWNKRRDRAGKPPGRRSPHGAAIPEAAPHLKLTGEVRPVTDPRSTLYNTDGQIFSDAGVPVVLFMENYDINRSGYHDTQDTMANIDLDYGAALAAIVIESVARAATQKPWE